DARVLVPRADTEILVETALSRTAERSMGRRYLDLCTGSGCVAISLAKERPANQVFAVDASGDALAVAKENAGRLGAASTVAWLEGDLLEPVAAFGRKFDLVTATPPYIPVGELASLAPDIRDFEPRLALSGGADGLDVVRRIVKDAPRFLCQGGVL